MGLGHWTVSQLCHLHIITSYKPLHTDMQADPKNAAGAIAGTISQYEERLIVNKVGKKWGRRMNMH